MSAQDVCVCVLNLKQQVQTQVQLACINMRSLLTKHAHTRKSQGISVSFVLTMGALICAAVKLNVSL